MPSSPLSVFIHQLRAVAERNGAGETDGELLTRFLSHRDDHAITALVRRHAPLVWGVCAAYYATLRTPRMRFRPRTLFLCARQQR